MNDFDNEVEVGNVIILHPSQYALLKLKNFEFIELWYFSPDGCRDTAKSSSSTMEDTFGISKVDDILTMRPVSALKQSHNVVNDCDLSVSDFFRAKNSFLVHIKHVSWPKKHINALAEFFWHLENHPIHNRRHGNTVMLLYAHRVRQSWHDDLKRGTAFNISKLNDSLMNAFNEEVVDQRRDDVLRKASLPFPLKSGGIPTDSLHHSRIPPFFLVTTPVLTTGPTWSCCLLPATGIHALWMCNPRYADVLSPFPWMCYPHFYGHAVPTACGCAIPALRGCAIPALRGCAPPLLSICTFTDVPLSLPMLPAGDHVNTSVIMLALTTDGRALPTSMGHAPSPLAESHPVGQDQLHLTIPSKQNHTISPAVQVNLAAPPAPYASADSRTTSNAAPTGESSTRRALSSASIGNVPMDVNPPHTAPSTSVPAAGASPMALNLALEA
ncbi:hypothetical protein PAXRUDRAFT_12322 [Paxillus rubicundulus Ve08.2h10]|uniref:Uncharacterized protein n=1 Tax=Paxillus rubicundulus Ve08.2h10 TaxID=930991 RepID=A0A0D0DA76_9AGAM|nr:hypothetical protein PAXRUDRAFT_12322 [Paxillus rubicundulus Ve08.2h10]